LLDHLFAEVDADEVLLEDVVVEHVLGGLAEVHDPLAKGWRPNVVCHLLRVARTGRMVVAADSADAAGDEMSVARVLAFHEDAVAPEDRGRAEALRNLLLLEVDSCVQPEAADNASNRVPDHFDQPPALARRLPLGRRRRRRHRVPPNPSATAPL